MTGQTRLSDQYRNTAQQIEHRIEQLQRDGGCSFGRLEMLYKEAEELLHTAYLIDHSNLKW